MERVPYKGYVIEARPKELIHSGRWAADIEIERPTEDSVLVKPYSSSKTFATREEALEHGIEFGRQIIDGRVEGCIAP